VNGTVILQVLVFALTLVVVFIRLRKGIPPGALLRWVRARLRARGQQRPAAVTRAHPAAARLTGDTGLVAAREFRERIRGRIFRAGTVILLVVVALAIVIPAHTRAAAQTQRVGVAGSLAGPLRAAVMGTGPAAGTTVQLIAEPDAAAARAALRSGQIDLAVIDGRQVLTSKPVVKTDSSVTAQLARTISRTLGADEALRAAGLTPAQAAALGRAAPLPMTSLQPGPPGGIEPGVSAFGLLLVFLMLTQYNAWTLIGVMEEKSSRVAEVLLAAVRPGQLLAGKVLGIGLVAFAQAAIVVAFAIAVAKAAGSDLLQGTTPVTLAATLAWLVLGYGFYCWVYAAAGSLAERRDQAQGLILPLALPIILGDFLAQATIASGSPSVFFEVLAYLPPTAPFAMPVLIELGRATWWEFAVSAAVSVACTAGVARLATVVYRRAILRTGRRVPLREVLAAPRRKRAASAS
jgi:ABC-2 type transport system permease protein